MIKMHYKKISAVLVAIGILTATGVWAENSLNASDKSQIVQDKKDARQEAIAQNVCDRVAQFADNLNQKASSQENQIKTRQQERLTAWSDRTSSSDANLEKLRDNWDNNRDEQFTKLEAAAKTDDQKEAVKTFEATVQAAIATRRTAEDAATKAFRAGVQNSVQTRQSQVDSLVSSSASARSAALAKVQAECASGADAATVRASFKNAMKSARTQLQSDKQAVTKVAATVQALIQTRQTAVKKAMGEFKTTMEKARITLKAAFPEQT